MCAHQISQRSKLTRRKRSARVNIRGKSARVSKPRRLASTRTGVGGGCLMVQTSPPPVSNTLIVAPKCDELKLV